MSVLADLAGKTRTERHDIKAAELVRLAPIRKHTAGRYEIEVRSVAPIKGGVEVFIRAWRDGKPLGFGPDGRAEIERAWISNPPILVPDPVGLVIRTWVDEASGKTLTRRLREDPAQALVDTLLHNIQLIGRTDTNVVSGRIARSHGVVYPNGGTGPAPTDAHFTRFTSEGWSTIRNGAGTNLNQSNTTLSASVNSVVSPSPEFEILGRAGMGFVTSAVGSDVISAAVLSLYGQNTWTALGDVGMGITSFSPVDEDSLAASEFALANWGGADFATRINASVFSTSGYNTFDLNASGIAHIDPDAITWFGLRLGWDIDGDTFGGSWVADQRTGVFVFAADETGVSTDPKLLVTHAAATADAPGALMMGGG